MTTILDDLAEVMHKPDGRTIEQMIAADRHDDIVVEKVEPHANGSGATICWNGGTCCGVKGAVPKVGDTVRMYGGAGLGQQHHGWALNGKVIEWKTPFERVLERVAWFSGFSFSTTMQLAWRLIRGEEV